VQWKKVSYFGEYFYQNFHRVGVFLPHLKKTVFCGMEKKFLILERTLYENFTIAKR